MLGGVGDGDGDGVGVGVGAGDGDGVGVGGVGVGDGVGGVGWWRQHGPANMCRYAGGPHGHVFTEVKL